jgi:hypothetical protein
MNAQKLQLKIFVTKDSARAIKLEALIPVFHRWIKDGVLPELMIDVANYLHVPEGPGVVLIGHGSDYFMDQGEGRLGLLHNRKRAGPPQAARTPERSEGANDTLDERLTDLARRTLHAAALLEGDPTLAGKLRFATGELLFRVNDRLGAPSSDATFVAVRPELEELGRRIFAGPFELTRAGGPKDLFAVRMTSHALAPLATLLERVGGPPVAR